MDRCTRARFIESALFSTNSDALSALLKVGTSEAFRSLLKPRQQEQFNDVITSSKLSFQRESELEALKQVHGRYLTPLCHAWPKVCTSPALFRVMGRFQERHSVALIGARKASTVSRHRARLLGRLLAYANVTVVSGGALGIDIEGLEGAHQCGGSTLTVLGSGLLYPAPKQHIQCFRQLLERGAILSEFPVSQKPTRWTFVRRNKWISELSHRVVVVQAGEKSGALTAARRSLSIARPVYVHIPRENHPDYSGCERLREAGAQCLSVLVDELLDSTGLQTKRPFLPQSQTRILNLIGTATSTAEKLSERLDLGFNYVLKSLIELEYHGWVARDECGRWFRRGLYTNRGYEWWLGSIGEKTGFNN